MLNGTATLNFLNRHKNLAAKYLSGNCNTAEKQWFEHWLSVSDENQRWFDNQKLIWNSSEAKSLKHDLDVELALSKVHQRIAFMHNHHKISVKQANRFSALNKWVASAAAVLLLGLAVFFVLKSESKQPLQHIAASQKMDVPLQLPDGSEVILNTNSEITYPQEFSTSKRTTSFRGEALFEVAGNPEKPFQILTDHFGVEVLGTKFNLNAMPGSDKYIVDLIEGKLRLFTFDQNPNDRIEQLVLLAGERGVFDVETRRIERTAQTDLNFMAWHSGILEFINMPLVDALETINASYHINFILSAEHKDLKITARFENESVEELIESLQTIYNFEVTRNGDMVYLN